MKTRPTIIVTTIQAPMPALEQITALRPDWRLLVVGDRKTPTPWQLDGADYIGITEQQGLAFKLAELLPLNHYSRKNLGYLMAISDQAPIIAETDDDNLPYSDWLSDVAQVTEVRPVQEAGWVNVYRAFTDAAIWPRGFPLDLLVESLKKSPKLGEPEKVSCPLQQFLADDSPDVDALYRLIIDNPVRFSGRAVYLGPQAWCPFNSQNTVWFPEAYPLLYLPSFVSFRMTDIWRSFVAQRCLHAAGFGLMFGPATMYQIRNEHRLMKDFEDEIPGYLHNTGIVETLEAVDLPGTTSDFGLSLKKCYEALIRKNFIPPEEFDLVDAWLADLATLSRDKG